MPFYYVSGVISTVTRGGMKELQIMEEEESGDAVCIAVVPFNANRRDGWRLARKDAHRIAEALNWQTSRESLVQSTE
jgi:hypothetical protein